jgi:Zn-finger nucleic acid-binding protein
MKCPTCNAELRLAGRTFRCASCDGAWVKSDVLVPLLEQSASALVELDWKPSGETHVRNCPECDAPMLTVQLGTVALDRCETHGVWFDRKELAELLKQAKQFRAPPHHEGVLKTLGKLFD